MHHNSMTKLLMGRFMKSFDDLATDYWFRYISLLAKPNFFFKITSNTKLTDLIITSFFHVLICCDH